MGLKGRDWFFGKAIDETNGGSPLSPLSAEAVELGIKGKHGTRGHMTQAIGAAQRFFETYPNYIGVIQQAPASPYEPAGQMLSDWVAFIGGKTGQNGRPDFGYDYDTLKGILTPEFGGTRTGGGGGNYELKVVLRLLAAFL